MLGHNDVDKTLEVLDTRIPLPNNEDSRRWLLDWLLDWQLFLKDNNEHLFRSSAVMRA